MKCFILSLTVVLAMASVSMAEYTVNLPNGSYSVSDATQLKYGLVSYTVTMYGYNGFAGLYIEGKVHQCEGQGMGVLPTLYNDQLSQYGPNAMVYDTHAIIPVGSLGSETISKNDGIDVITAPNDPGVDSSSFSNFTDTGMGTFDMTANGAAGAKGVAESSYVFMQVVIPACSMVRLYGILSVNGAEDTIVDKHGNPGVDIPDTPEPSTVIMLVLGSLCFAGYRLRK